MKQKIFIAFISSIILSTLVYAQDNLPVDEVDVIKRFDASIGNVSIIPNTPKILAPDSTQRKGYQYDVSSSPLDLRYQPQVLRPLAMPRTQVEDTYRGYVRGAYGLPNSIMGQLNYAYAGESGFELGVHGLHNSVNNDKNLENQRYMYNDFGVNFAQEFSGGLRLHADFDYSLNDNYTYGYDHEKYSYSPIETKRRYHTFKAETGISNSSISSSSLNYDARFQYYRFANNVATRQNDFNLFLSATKWIQDSNPLSIELGTLFTTVKDTATHELHNFFLKPSYTLHGSSYKLKLGMALYSNSDEFYFFPDAEFEMFIVDNRFVPFIGADGGLTKNSYRTVATYNPFVTPRIDTVTNTLDRRYYGGLKGQIGKMSYQASLGYQSLNSLALYNPYTPGPGNHGYYEVFNVDGSKYYIQASLSYSILKSLNLLTTISKSFYSLEDDIKPYGLPTFELNAQLEYLLFQEKMRLWFEAYLEDPIQFRIADDVISAAESNFCYDFNIGGEYFFSKHFGVNIQLYNILNNQYQRWYNSPNIGFQGLVGLTARF